MRVTCNGLCTVQAVSLPSGCKLCSCRGVAAVPCSSHHPGTMLTAEHTGVQQRFTDPSAPPAQLHTALRHWVQCSENCWQSERPDPAGEAAVGAGCRPCAGLLWHAGGRLGSGGTRGTPPTPHQWGVCVPDRHAGPGEPWVAAESSAPALPLQVMHAGWCSAVGAVCVFTCGQAQSGTGFLDRDGVPLCDAEACPNTVPLMCGWRETPSSA